MNQPEAAAPPPGPIAGLAVTAIVVVAVIGWAVLGTALFSALSLFGGYLMLWHWANIEHLDVRRLPAALVGALAGIALAWQVVYLTETMGNAGTVIGLLIMVAAIYLHIINAVPMVFNAAAMLYLTVAAAPLIQLKINFVELALATVVGGVFFAAFVEGAKWLAAKFAPAQ